MGFIIQSCYYDNEEYLYNNALANCDTSNVTFSSTISPILSSNCNFCHSSTAPSGGVILDNYNSIKAEIDKGTFWGSINHISGFSAMPKGGNKLNECFRKQILIWIDTGAPNN
ncbi:hypothetical protein ACFLRI_04920 [Bacteroidota bacterium]